MPYDRHASVSRPRSSSGARARHVLAKNACGQILIARAAAFLHRHNLHPPERAERQLGRRPLMAAVEELDPMRRRRLARVWHRSFFTSMKLKSLWPAAPNQANALSFR